MQAPDGRDGGAQGATDWVVVLSQVLIRGMAKDPGARPPTAGQFAGAALAAASS